MGQRLNLEIKDGDKVLANCYYHWSGYSYPAMVIAQRAVKYIEKHRKEESGNGEEFDKKKLAVDALYNTGAGLGMDDIWYVMAKLAEKKDLNLTTEFAKRYKHCDRNDGLIGLFPASIEENQKWAEMTVEIDINTDSVEIGDIWWHVDVDEYSSEELSPENLPVYNVPCVVSFEDMDDMVAVIDEINRESGMFWNKDCFEACEILR